MLHVICIRLRPGHLSVRVENSSRRCKTSRIAPLNAIIIIFIMIWLWLCDDGQDAVYAGESGSWARTILAMTTVVMTRKARTIWELIEDM